ncbi:MAG: phosphatase 2C-like domain-containing protein [Podila humilis]|nr:MAG: phosphatase 2C-like domain-containing protein [Podila humilis]
MLGRNAARPLGLTPARLLTAYNMATHHRIAYWITKPFAMVHMQRFITISPQLLLTIGGSSTLTLTKNPPSSASPTACGPSAPSSSSSPPSHQVHTLAPLQTDVLLQSLPSPPPTPAPCSPTTSTSDRTTQSSTPTTTAPSSVAYNYMLAASWSPKSRRRATPTPEQDEEWWRNPTHYHTKSGSTTPLSSTTKRRGKVDAGEDAFFHVSTPSRVALGVADGVGGWSEFGVDPALFSWALMEHAEKIARLTDNIADMRDDPESKDRVLDAQTILDGAYHRLVESGNVEAGSSTACILSLCKSTGTLRASNLGDSSFLLIRDKRCIYESPSQQHFWNCPYQLTIVPPGFRSSKSSAKKSGSYVQDLPKDAAQSTHQLEDGDVIVLATDGFWDNVFTKETIELVDKELGDIIRDKSHHSPSKPIVPPFNHHPLPLQQLSQQLQSEEAPLGKHGSEEGQRPPLTAEQVLARVRALSQRLTNTARHISLDQTRNTPFSESAQHLRSGGKVDDITVIVTLVRSI